MQTKTEYIESHYMRDSWPPSMLDQAYNQYVEGVQRQIENYPPGKYTVVYDFITNVTWLFTTHDMQIVTHGQDIPKINIQGRLPQDYSNASAIHTKYGDTENKCWWIEEIKGFVPPETITLQGKLF